MYLNELLSNTALTENKFATAKKVFDWLMKGKKLQGPIDGKTGNATYDIYKFVY